jgi:hypothetical protein
MYFIQFLSSTKVANLLQKAGYYQAPLEDISFWPFLVARAGYAMMEWCVPGLEWNAGG